MRADQTWQDIHDRCEFCAHYEFDAEGYVTSWNEGAEKLEGYKAEEIIGKHFTIFYPEEGLLHGTPERRLLEAKGDGRYRVVGWRVRRDGTQYWAEITLDPLRDEKGGVVGFRKTVRNISRRKAAEDGRDEARKDAVKARAELQENQRLTQLLIQSVSDYAIFMLDPEGKVRNWNSGAQRIKGYAADEIIGQHFSRFYTDEDRARGEPQRVLDEALNKEVSERVGWRVRKDGNRFWAHIIVRPVRDPQTEHLLGFSKVVRDITKQHEIEEDRKRVEEEKRLAQEELEHTREALAQAQKMEALGKLTGGMAHDFNNILTAIDGNLAAIEPFNDRNRKHVDAARRSAALGAQTVRQLLTFARRVPHQVGAYSPNALIQGFETVLRPSVGHSNELVIDLDRNARQVLVDAGQFQFALLNLVANAKDAMQDAGCVRISTRNITVDERLADKWRVAPGDYVAVAVSDTGRGMPPDVVDRAFEPGFTTKEVGKGSGLGLSSVYGFVAQSHGHAEISSRQGHGTTVTLYLPATAIQVLPGGLEQSEDRLPAGRGTVLVVDDDPAVMAIASELLEQRGFRILSAPNGKIALKTLGGAAGVDVLFTDFAMPGMDGLELADHARKMRPGLQVLLTSGYAPELIEMRGIEFIPKPYGIEELTARIADMASRHSG